MAEQLYRIHWRSLLTKATGHGTTAFSRDSAEGICTALNLEDRGMLEHWIEPEPPAWNKRLGDELDAGNRDTLRKLADDAEPAP